MIISFEFWFVGEIKHFDIRQASSCLIDIWEPLSFLFSGVINLKFKSFNSSSYIERKKANNFSDLSSNLIVVASIVISSVVFRVDYESIWGVPLENLLIDIDSSYVSEKSNGLLWLNHPLIGDFNLSISLFLTYINAGDPGPPFKYL